MINYGYIDPEITPEDFVFGANQLGDNPVNPGGQWDSWLPVAEDQDINGIEPFACVSFATLNTIETLIRQEFGEVQNLSDRWLAYTSGTQLRKGNDSGTVTDTLRKKGDVLETDWPLDATVLTFDDFYKTPPDKLKIAALELTQEFNIGREWVGSDAGSLMEALEYSPVTAGVFAWRFDPVTGLYIRPKGALSCHCIMIYGYEKGEYWKIFDSYDQNCKKLAWDFGFDACMRLTLHRNIINETAWQKFWKQFRAFLGL